MVNGLLPPGGARAVARCDLLGRDPFTDEAGLLFRPWLGPGYHATIEALSAWMREAGMTVRRDAAATLIGRYEGTTPDAPALLIGSHVDSVRDAGNYDGMLGVVIGIELVERLNAQGKRFPFAIEVVGFGDEEGSRFPETMISTRALAGVLDDSNLHELRDRDGILLSTALLTAGLTVPGLNRARRDPATVLAWIEAHIEQGPVLEAEGQALGVVTAIAAQRRYEVKLHGRAGHSGTMAMPLRHDALAAAAEMILAVENATADGPDGLVGTVGALRVWPGVVNVVPGDVVFSIDVRAGTDDIRNRAADRITDAIREISARRGVTAEIILRQELPAVHCDPALDRLLGQAVREVTGTAERRLVSGAGHDAMIMAHLTPVSMLFIRCREGISHNPEESVMDTDVELAIAALERFVTLYEETP
ncbi:allantoate amidohydrolase [Acetobacter sp. AN02]|uniref:allantoate amidohydrolase n=1 Tax=Acetobacter sp. AN02 TaxID=2894186 RepID=UPI00243418A7|nr:allantoate amidohydrolase [Acetobacter sp. AN02]MDG6094769.1 allantoate amidohydrolase [Acetobacter sp. AN02]